jgi:hypothetical protein
LCCVILGPREYVLDATQGLDSWTEVPYSTGGQILEGM